MKRPFDTVREIFFENILKSRDNSKFIFEHSDKLIVWIVGFSIGGLSLIISRNNSLYLAIDSCILKFLVILLTISTISGILYRISFYIYQIQFRKGMLFLENIFADKEIMRITSDDLTNESDIKVVIRRLNEDYGEDFSKILEFYYKDNTEAKEVVLKNLKAYYHKTNEWAKNDYNEAILFAKYAYRKAFKLNEKQIERIFEKEFTNNINLFEKISIICFMLCCFTFISVIITLCVNYMR